MRFGSLQSKEPIRYRTVGKFTIVRINMGLSSLSLFAVFNDEHYYQFFSPNTKGRLISKDDDVIADEFLTGLFLTRQRLSIHEANKINMVAEFEGTLNGKG